MPRVSAKEYYALPLRAHALLAGVPLHDVWAVDLSRPRAPRTLTQFAPLLREGQSSGGATGISRALFRIRFLLGRVFGLEAEPRGADESTFAARLTPEDRARSTVEPGTREGIFRTVYRFENESLLEVHNRTVHGALLNALVETPDGYRFYLAVYVAKSSWATPLYMACIDPFRRWFIYPAMLKNIRATWLKASII